MDGNPPCQWALGHDHQLGTISLPTWRASQGIVPISFPATTEWSPELRILLCVEKQTQLLIENNRRKGDRGKEYQLLYLKTKQKLFTLPVGEGGVWKWTLLKMTQNKVGS